LTRGTFPKIMKGETVGHACRQASVKGAGSREKNCFRKDKAKGEKLKKKKGERNQKQPSRGGKREDHGSSRRVDMRGKEENQGQKGYSLGKKGE